MAILLGLLSMCATLIGGLVAVHIGESKRLVPGLAAGVMLGVVFFDLLPEAHAGRPSHGPPVCTVAGVLAMLLVAELSR